MVVISGHVVNRPSKRRQAESGGIEVILMQTKIADLNGSFNIGRESSHLDGKAIVSLDEYLAKIRAAVEELRSAKST